MATSRPTVFGTWYNDLKRQLYSSPLGSFGGDWGRQPTSSIAKFRASNQLAGGVVSYGRPRPRSPRPGYAVRPPLQRRPSRPRPSSGWFGNDPLTTHNIGQLADEVGVAGGAVGPALAIDKFTSALPLPAQLALAPLFLGPQTIASIAGKAADIAGDVGSFVGGLFGGGPPAPSPTYYAGDTSGGGGSGHARERVF